MRKVSVMSEQTPQGLIVFLFCVLSSPWWDCSSLSRHQGYLDMTLTNLLMSQIISSSTPNFTSVSGYRHNIRRSEIRRDSRLLLREAMKHGSSSNR